MYSRIAADTTKHSVILTVWFGTFSFESHQEQLQHSWLLQIKTDFAALSPWIQEAQRFSLDPKYAFQHPELWVFFDFSVLKAAEISNSIAPWQHQELQQAVVTPTFLQSLHCKLIRDDGLVCQWIGESLNAVRRHITTSKYHKLSRTPCPSMMAITPTCPWCCSQLSSIESCANHIRRSFTRRTCPTKHSGHFQNPAAEIHRDLFCPLCKFFCADEKEYQLHVQSFHGSPVDGQNWQCSPIVCGTIDSNIATQLCVAPDIFDVDAILMDHARRFWTSLCSNFCTDGRGGGETRGQEEEAEADWRRTSNHNYKSSQNDGQATTEAGEGNWHAESMPHRHLSRGGEDANFWSHGKESKAYQANSRQVQIVRGKKSSWRPC